MATMGRNDAIVSKPRGTVNEVYEYASLKGAHRKEFVFEYLAELYRLCTLLGFDFSILAAQADNESDTYRSPNFDRYGNTIGLGITDSQNMSRTYTNGVDMARAHMVHMYVYSIGKISQGHLLYPYIYLDPRYQAVLDAKWQGKVKTLNDFNGTGYWASVASTPNYGDRIIERGKYIFGDRLPKQRTEIGEPPVAELVFGRVKRPQIIEMIVEKPYHEGSAYGYDRVAPRKNVGLVHHETQGRGTGQWYHDFFSCPGGERCRNALVDFFIDRAGRIFMLNDPFGTRAGWANGGGVGSPGGLEGDGVAFYTHFGSVGVNQKLVSIEYEKYDAENMTPAQYQSGGALAAWIHDMDKQPWNAHPFVPQYNCVTSLAHFELGTTNCGKGELDDISQIQAVTKGIMKAAQTGASSEPVPPEVPPLPLPPLPGGISEEEAKLRFGYLTKHNLDGTTRKAYFDRRGPISLAWAHKCAELGLDFEDWPAGGDWYVQLESEGDPFNIITFKNSDLLLIQKSLRSGLIWV